MRRDLKPPLAYKNIQRDQQRGISYRWSPHCQWDKKIRFWDIDIKKKKKGEKDKLQTSSHEQEEQRPKSWLSFGLCFLCLQIRVVSKQPGFPCSHPSSSASALSLRALAGLEQVEYDHLKSSLIVWSGCHMSHVMSYGNLALLEYL